MPIATLTHQPHKANQRLLKEKFPVMNSKSLILLAAALTVSPLAAPPLDAQQTTGQPLAKEAVLSALTSKLDTKKTKVGDPVTAKTLNALTLTDGTVLPSGSKLTGKVTQAQPKSGGGATLAIEFDQLEKKGAAATPVHGLIVAIAPIPDLGNSGGAAGNDLPGRGSAAQNASMSGMSTGPGSEAQPSIPAGSSIKGVVLNPTAAADGSSVLQSPEKDFKLETGTRLEIGLTTPAK
jgi:hypothetical protein